VSVCYYVACKKCLKCYHIAQDGLSGFTFYSGEPKCVSGLGPFLGEHILCGEPLVILSEHAVEDYDEVEWPREVRDRR
jgi:hypothetical protein